MHQQKAAENYKNKILAESAKVMQQIGTREGFIQYYFTILPRCKSQAAAFNVVNLMYELLFGKEMFTTYSSFKKYKNRGLK